MFTREIIRAAIMLHKTIERIIATSSLDVNNGTRQSVEFNINIDAVGHGFRPFGAKPGEGSFIDYSISVYDECVVKSIPNMSQVRSIFDELSYRLEKTKRKFKNASFVDAEAQQNTWNSFKYPHTVIILGEPCEEFVKMRNLIRRYTEKELTMTDLYSVLVGYDGGIYRGEQGRRNYLCFDKDYCKSVLDFLKKRKDSRFKFKMGFYECNDIDSSSIHASAETLDWVHGTGYRKIWLEMRTPTQRTHRFE